MSTRYETSATPRPAGEGRNRGSAPGTLVEPAEKRPVSDRSVLLVGAHSCRRWAIHSLVGPGMTAGARVRTVSSGIVVALLAFWIPWVTLAGAACGGGQRRAAPPRAATTTVPPPASLDWDGAMARLATDLSANLRTSGSGLVKVAVIDLTTPDGRACPLGGVIAEELTTRLFAAGRFEVIERRQLQRILQEQQMSVSDLLDPASAARLGRLVGTRGLVTGTIATAGDSYRINARIILVETAAVASVASAEVGAAHANRYGACVGGTTASVTAGMPPGATALSPSGTAQASAPSLSTCPPDAFVCEDFSSVPVGQAPPSWLGTEHYIVQEDARGQRTFNCFERGSARFSIPTAHVPPNFRLEIVVTRPRWNSWGNETGIRLSLGMLRAGLVGTGSAFINTATGLTSDPLPVNTPVTMAVEKRADVYRLFVDGREVVLARYADLQFQPLLVVNLNEYGHGGGSLPFCEPGRYGAVLHRVVGIPLE